MKNLVEVPVRLKFIQWFLECRACHGKNEWEIGTVQTINCKMGPQRYSNWSGKLKNETFMHTDPIVHGHSKSSNEKQICNI